MNTIWQKKDRLTDSSSDQKQCAFSNSHITGDQGSAALQMQWMRMQSQQYYKNKRSSDILNETTRLVLSIAVTLEKSFFSNMLSRIKNI